MKRWLWVIALAGCNKVEHPFPEGFLWGSAVAGFQVEAGCPTLPADECEDRGSDWYQWVTDPTIVADEGMHVAGDPLSRGPGMWETFEADADRLDADGMNGFRMGIEWSRLFPDPAAETATTVDELAAYADADAVARYHEMFAALRDRDIEPVVTINHYTLPIWLHDGVACHHDPETCEDRGWVDGERIIPAIGLYAGFVGREYGDEVDLWATLNEPLAIPLAGYLAPGADRTNPPGLSADGVRGKAAYQNQILGHGAMYDAVKAEDTADADGDGTAASVGLVMNMAVIRPYAPEEEDDVRAAERCDHVYHAMFLDGVTSGAWDDDMDGTFESTKPELVGRLDWVGVNYYASVAVRGLPMPLLPEIPALDFFPEISWVPEPAGIAVVTARSAEYGLPVYVTENGTSNVADEAWRAEMLADTLFALQGAAERDDVRGYFYWSYVDNYEWNHGMDVYRFGLYGLDDATKDRVAKPVLERYREIVDRNGFDD